MPDGAQHWRGYILYVLDNGFRTAVWIPAAMLRFFMRIVLVLAERVLAERTMYEFSKSESTERAVLYSYGGDSGADSRL